MPSTKDASKSSSSSAPWAGAGDGSDAGGRDKAGGPALGDSWGYDRFPAVGLGGALNDARTSVG